jgi:hypothetical protein
VTGTASVDGGTLNITDLQALVNGTRIMMMSTANGLLYDGTITNITQNSFTADFTVYTDGQNPIMATVSGTITQGSSITGTLTGTGAGSGTFSLMYASSNNQTAALSKIDNNANSFWSAVMGGGPGQFEFEILPTGELVDSSSANAGIFDLCEISNGSTVLPIAGTNLYQVSISGLSVCTDTNVEMSYTGLATTRTQNSVDDRLVFMTASGSYGLYGDLD